MLASGTGKVRTFQTNGTYLIQLHDVALHAGGDNSYTDRLNIIYQPLRFKARAAVSWDHGPLNARLMISHVGSYTNDTVNPRQDVASYSPVDLTLGWRLDEAFKFGFTKSMTLGLEVRNLFDRDPPYVNSRPGANGGGGYDASVTNPIGREMAVSLRARF